MAPTRHLAGLLVAALLAVGLAACGGDDDDPNDPPDAGPETSTSAPTTEPEGTALCATLTTEGFEIRRIAVEDAPASELAAAGDECPTDVNRVEAAVGVMETADPLSTDMFDITLANECVVGNNGRFETTLSIQALDVPVDGLRNLGVAGTVRIGRDGAGITGGVGEFFDFANQTARESSPTTTHIGGTVPADTADNASGLSCTINAGVYLNDRSGADAGLDQPADLRLADPDPAVWFSALIETERQWRTDGDTDLAAVTVDVRHPGYLDMVGADDIGVGPFGGDIVPCVVSNSDDERAEITYAATLDGTTTLYYLTFRRGSDGAWRRLIDPMVLGDGAGCDGAAFLYEHRSHEPLG